MYVKFLFPIQKHYIHGNKTHSIMPFKTYHERNLPHILPAGKMFFITCTLEGSLPKHLTDKWKLEKELAIKKVRNNFEKLQNNPNYSGKERTLLGEDRKKAITRIQKLYFKKWDDYLDQSMNGPTYLKQPEIAKVLVNKFFQYDGLYYDLIAFTIMSNHFHILLDTSIQLKKIHHNTPLTNDNYVQVNKFIGLIKGGSAFEANKLLGRKGKFWMPEPYDHLVRDMDEFFNIIRYILNNPVKAGLITDWKDWNFSYLKDEFHDVKI